MTSLPDPTAVLVSRHHRTMVVTINRPHVRNAVDLEVSRLIGSALERADQDPEVYAVVVTGAGDRAFCAGADLKALARGEPITPADSPWGFAGYVRHFISKPTIAAVNGVAVGGGTEIVLASDLAVASDTARFGLPEVTRGMLAGAGGPFRLMAQVPAKLAMELLLTGATINAEEAARFGLVNRVCPAHQVLDQALRLADTIAANAPLAVQATKRVAKGVTDGATPSKYSAWRRSDTELRLIKASEDAREGPRAFAEKRSPRWRAR